MNKFCTAACLLLMGCGGGGGDSSPPPPSLSSPENVSAEYESGRVTVSWESDAETHHIYYSDDPDMEVDNYAAYGGTWLQDVSSPHEFDVEPGPDIYVFVTAASATSESTPSKTGPVFTRYIALGDVVADYANDLEWRRCSEGQTWSGETCIGEADRFNDSEARSHAGSIPGWRLPTFEELKSLVYCSSGEPAYFAPDNQCLNSGSSSIYPIFPNTSPRGYANSTLFNLEDVGVYIKPVDFSDGSTAIGVTITPNLEIHVRLVREMD